MKMANAIDAQISSGAAAVREAIKRFILDSVKCCDDNRICSRRKNPCKSWVWGGSEQKCKVRIAKFEFHVKVIVKLFSPFQTSNFKLRTILALDLGKFNTMCCFFDTKTRKHTCLNAATQRNCLETVFKKHKIDLVTMEACGPSGWINDLAISCGLKTIVCLTNNPALLALYELGRHKNNLLLGQMNQHRRPNWNAAAFETG
jgi:hypothetical protein